MPSTYELETLVTRFDADIKDLKLRLKEAEDAFKHVEKSANRSAGAVEQILSGLGATAVSTALSILGIGSALGVAFRGVKLAADAEALATTFRVLVGDVDRADKALRDLEQFALTTPFEMPELMEASKMMLAFGEEVENIVPAMRMLGDIAAGVDAPLKDLAYLFGTLRSQGRAFTIDIRQFAMRGIPIYLELAKVLGLVGKDAKKTTTDVRQAMDKMIEHGQVNFEMVEQAFKNMTGAGGQFFGMMDARSKTLKGLFNEMKESIDLSLRKIGESLIEGLNLHEVIREITKFTNVFNEWLKSLSPETRRAIFNVMALTAVFVGLTAAAIVLKFAISAAFGPIGLVAGAITTIIGLTAVWADSVGGLDKAWRKLSRAAEDFWAFIKPALPALAALLLVTSGPIGVIIAGIALLVSYWDEVSAAVSQFWTEAQPVLRAAWDLLKVIGFTLRNYLVWGFNDVVESVKNFNKWLIYVRDNWDEIYQNMNSGSKVIVTALGLILGPIALIGKAIAGLFPTTRDELRDVLFYAEYVWGKFGSYAELAVFRAAYRIEQLEGNVRYFFDTVLMNSLNWFLKSWETVFTAAYNIGKEFVEGIVGMLIDGIASVPDILSGKTNISDIAKKYAATFKAVLTKEIKNVKGPEIPPRKTTEAEEIYKTIIKEKQVEVDRGFDDFKKKKLELWEKDDLRDAAFDVGDILGKIIADLPPAAGEVGAAAGTEFAKEFGKAASKWDATIFGSAEAVQRLQHYRDAFPTDVQQIKNINVAPTQVVQSTPAPPNEAERVMVTLLQELLHSSQEIEKKPPVVIGKVDM